MKKYAFIILMFISTSVFAQDIVDKVVCDVVVEASEAAMELRQGGYSESAANTIMLLAAERAFKGHEYESLKDKISKLFISIVGLAYTRPVYKLETDKEEAKKEFGRFAKELLCPEQEKAIEIDRKKMVM